jgi:hypothetical protein
MFQNARYHGGKDILSGRQEVRSGCIRGLEEDQEEDGIIREQRGQHVRCCSDDFERIRALNSSACSWSSNGLAALEGLAVTDQSDVPKHLYFNKLYQFGRIRIWSSRTND